MMDVSFSAVMCAAHNFPVKCNYKGITNQLLISPGIPVGLNRLAENETYTTLFVDESLQRKP